MTLAQQCRHESHVRAEPVNKRERVFQLIKEHQAISSWQLAELLHWAVYVVRPRVTELAEDARIQAVGKIYHQETDRNETLWAVAKPGQLEFKLKGGPA